MSKRFELPGGIERQSFPLRTDGVQIRLEMKQFLIEIN